MSEIKKLYGEDAVVIGDNRLPTDFSKKNNVTTADDLTRISTEKVSGQNEIKLIKTLLYSFIGVVSIISIITIFNIIHYSLLLRKREIASLKSMGMSNKQVRKMNFLESIFYGLSSSIAGGLVSLVLLYVVHIVMFDFRVYKFEIPILSIVCAILVMYVVIILGMILARRELKNRNIIDEIRNENI